jgi:hypothetical protein
MKKKETKEGNEEERRKRVNEKETNDEKRRILVDSQGARAI